ncbi:PrrC protein [Candidatus Micropelagos thuwalensis]|uniref:PrrC protein n=2 Tax=Candidatus Micropelagius thuwalensis TaxID=1397666 RepID=U2XNB1_9PROT|nr:PrrC protein [Candidatus Micropelagos thuwalensis]
MLRILSIFLISLALSACGGGGGGGGYGGNSLTQNNADTSNPGAGPTTTESSGITLYTSDGEQYSGEYHQMEDGTYHSGPTHDATLPEGHQILTQTPPANPTEVPNTTMTQSGGYSNNSGSGYGLAQSQFDIFNNVYESEGITFVTSLPQIFQLPYDGTNLSVFTTSNISRMNELLSSIERYTTGLTFELNNISDYKFLSSVGVSHISGYGDFEDAIGSVLELQMKSTSRDPSSITFRFSNFVHPIKGSFYNFDREDETYEVRYEKQFYLANHKLGVELNFKDKSSSVNTYDFDMLKVKLKADF